MNLQTHIKPDLWKAIESTYQNENYTHSIVDTMHYLSDFLREKTGVEGDGASLVGQALGGDSPRLRVNKLQTDTEKSIQKGLEHLLRGLYMAIRNPRSHEQCEDSKETADSIVYFINHLLMILDKSEEPFVLDKFAARVFDPAFVKSERYASLLVDEIPDGKRIDTMIHIYRNKTEGDGEKLALLFKALFSKISEQQEAQFISVVSEELKSTNDNTEMRMNLQLLNSKPNLWLKVSEVARLRIENLLIQSIKSGLKNPDYEKLVDGALGTWATSYVQYFTLKRELGTVLFGKIIKEEPYHQLYVATYFYEHLPDLLTDKWRRNSCVRAISKSIREGDENITSALLEVINGYPEDWRKAFVEELKDITDENDPRVYLYDGTPLLKSLGGHGEIPF